MTTTPSDHVLRTSRPALIAALIACLAPITDSLAHGESQPTWLWWEDWNGPANHADSAQAVLALNDGSVLVAGRAYNPTPPLVGSHPALLRYGHDGSLLWSVVEPSYITWSKLRRTTAGDALVTGLVFAGGSWNVVVRRINLADGSTTWESTRPAAASFGAFTPSIVEDPATQSVLVAAWRGERALVVRFAMSDGAFLGETLLEQSATGDDMATSVAPLADGGFVVASTQGGMLDGYRVSAHDASGRVLWVDVEKGAIGNLFTPGWLGVDAQGNVLVGGGTETSCGLFEFRAWKLSPQGVRQWTVHWPPGFCQSAEPADFAMAPDGSIAMAGQTHNPFDLAVLHVSPNGEFWTRTWNGPVGGIDEGVAVDFDAGGNVIVGGTVVSASGDAVALISYDPSGNQRFALVGSAGSANGKNLVDLDVGRDAAAGTIAIAADGSVGSENTNIFAGLLHRSLPTGDIDGDGAVGPTDLSLLLGSWGRCSGTCLADIDGDGSVGAGDLAVLLGGWSL